MKDKLFLVKPGFLNAGNGPLYCSDSLPVEGMLSFFPELRRALDIQYVDFPRPRAALVKLLGEERQGLPVLVLAEGRVLKAGVPEPKAAQGRLFLDDERQIRKYLAAQYGFPASSAEAAV